MLKRALFIFYIVCLLGLFLLSMSGAPAYATDEESEVSLEASDTVQQQQDSPVDYKSRGNTLLKKGQFDDAISDLSKAIKLDPDYVNAYINRGLYYHTRHEYPKAIDDYNKALELDPLSPTANRLLSRAITDRDIYEMRVLENFRICEMGGPTRQNRNP